MPAVSVRASRLWLASILLVYLLLASAYAAYTPAWQAPDEPAHYNYIRYIAEHGTLPELKPGDYPAGYLEEIKAARFARPYSIDPIRYESHQPPLYYLLATPVFLLGRAVGMETPLLPLRLFSVALSLFSLLVAYRLVRVLTPNRPMIALGTVAFMAFLPMRLAVTGAVNNDVLVALTAAGVHRGPGAPDQAASLCRRPTGVLRLGMGSGDRPPRASPAAAAHSTGRARPGVGLAAGVALAGA
jgi:hypothetical protein